MTRSLISSVLVAALMLCANSCRQADIRTIKIDVPEMNNSVCAEIIGRAVAGLKGVVPDKTVADLSERTVTVTYDSLKLSLKNVEFAIADAGFQANDVPANAEQRAKLPQSCRSTE